MLQWPLQEAAEMMMMIIIIIVIICVCYWLHVNAFYLSDFVYWPTPQLQMSFSHSVFWCHQLQQCSTSRPTNYTAFSATEWKPSAIILLHVSFGYSLCIWPSSTTCRCECLGIGLLHQVNILSQDRNGEYSHPLSEADDYFQTTPQNHPPVRCTSKNNWTVMLFATNTLGLIPCVSLTNYQCDIYEHKWS